MTRSFRIDWSGESDVGRVRAVNEDSYLGLPERGIWVVADGMGGHAGGDWASAHLTAAIAAGPAGDTFEEAVECCAASIHAANAAIWQEARTRGTQMGTTVVAVLVRDGRFAALWAGDSRAYLLRDAKLLRLTRDHSQVQALIDRGLLSEADGAGHPMAHVLARAVGVEPTLALDVVTDTLAPDDVLLLTSDGVHGVVGDEQIAHRAGQATVAQVPRLLIEQGLANGSADNLTAVAIGLSEATLLMVGAQA